MRKSLLSLLLVLALLTGCAPASGPPAETGSAPQAAASSQPFRKALPFSSRWASWLACWESSSRDFFWRSTWFQVAAACCPAVSARSSSSLRWESWAPSWARTTACSRRAWAWRRFCSHWGAVPSNWLQAAWFF